MATILTCDRCKRVGNMTTTGHIFRGIPLLQVSAPTLVTARGYDLCWVCRMDVAQAIEKVMENAA